MAPALAPAMMAKAENLAATVMREMRQESCVLRINEDLDICGPNQKEAFSVTITPALITSIGALALGIYLIWVVKVWLSDKNPWGPAELPSDLKELAFGKLIGGMLPKWP